MLRHRPLRWSAFAVLLLAACSRREEIIVVPEAPRLVSIQLEAFDPGTGYVWQGVAVRVVDATLEWSGATIPHIDPQAWEITDAFGTVLFDEYDLAAADVGFVLDAAGRAVLEPQLGADEAIIRIELSAPGFTPVVADVLVSWADPDVFVSIPF